MRIIKTLELALDTKDPAEAIAQTLTLLETAATLLPSASLAVTLSAVAQAGVLRCLAESLPAETRGFFILRKGASVQKLKCTAGQFLAHLSPGDGGGYSGTLPSLWPLPEALDRFRALTELGSAVRGTAFGFQITGLQWRGAPTESTGTLALSDYKYYKRRVRFAQTAQIELEGPGPNDADVRRAIANAAAASGLPFQRGKLSSGATRPAAARKSGQAFADQFSQAWAIAATQARALHAQAPVLPGLHSARDAMRNRLQGHGHGEPVDFWAAIAPWCEGALPGFELRHEEGQTKRFHRSLSPGLELAIAIERVSFFGLGKAFMIKAGVAATEGAHAGTLETRNLFQLWNESSDGHATFAYNTLGELQGSLAALAALLAETLPILDGACSSIKVA